MKVKTIVYGFLLLAPCAIFMIYALQFSFMPINNCIDHSYVNSATGIVTDQKAKVECLCRLTKSPSEDCDEVKEKS